MKSKNHLQNILYGLAVGDALGVPVEFKDRSYLKQNPIRTMQGFGAHDVPAGVWSDDSSLTIDGQAVKVLAERDPSALRLMELITSFRLVTD